jgi:DNA-directed RNA polymerase specialized sigma24 family protein
VSLSLDRSELASLYDRHGSDVFNFCLRVVDSRGVAASATRAAFLTVRREPQRNLLAEARRETARLIEAAREDPAPAGSPLQVREANGRLATRHREVLALRELVGSSYAEIARIVGADGATVAQLLWRARLELRDELKGTRLAPIAPVGESCRRALALIAMDWDSELRDGEEQDWLRRHLRTCGKCRLSQKAAREASATYRAWPIAAPPMGLPESLLSTDLPVQPAAGSETSSRSPPRSPPPSAPRGARRSPR